MVVTVIIIIIIMDPQGSRSQTVTEGRPTAHVCASCQVLWARASMGTGQEGPVLMARLRALQTVLSNARVATIPLTWDGKGRKLRPPEPRV